MNITVKEKDSSSKNDRILDSGSPIMKQHKTKLRNKENNLDEINPVSERSSMASLKKSNISPMNRTSHRPPHNKALKEKSVAHLSNLLYYEPTSDDNVHSNPGNFKNIHKRDAMS